MTTNRIWVIVVVLLTLPAYDPHRDLMAKHRKAQVLWERQNLSDYRFRFKRLCEGKHDYLREVSIAVSKGDIVDITFADDQSPVPPEMWTSYPTVAGMFQEIETAAAERAFEVRATYDSDAGYPRDIFTDGEELIADDETIWQVSDLQGVTVPSEPAPMAAQLQVPQRAEDRFSDTVRGLFPALERRSQGGLFSRAARHGLRR